MNLQRIHYWASALQYTLNILFIGAFFSIDLPTRELLLILGKVVFIAIPVGIFLAWFQKWAMEKQQYDENEQNT
ncbi:MAG: hypothetical protein H6555_04655 [Lewinellaceae bacterium]|nr:hypothetical protein [Lewinellaceae bacterium]